MALNSGVWGIDIGQSALKAIRLELVDGNVNATAFDYIEHPKILSQPDADADQLIKDALDQFLSRNTLKGDKIAIGVPGQSGLARFVKLPPVEEKKIADIVKFEAKQQIPFPLEEVVWDFQKIGQGVVTDGFAIDTEIGLFAMKRDMINRFLGHFAGVNVEVHTVQMAPLALCNYVTYDLLKRGGPTDEEPKPVAGKRQCAVALDIGTDSSNLIITDGGRIIWQRPIPLGGNHFTRALTKELKLTFAKAEHLKRNAAKSPELPNILKALKPVLTDFVGEVQRSLGYFTNTHRDAAITYMVGLGSAFRLPGLQKYLADKLQLDIRKIAGFERMGGESVTSNEVFKENVLTFPVAFGLALQGLGAARLGTNLLPPEITLDRKIRAKKPWAVAAAAMLLVGSTVLAYMYSMPYAAVNAEVVHKQMKSDDDEMKRAKGIANEIATRQAEVEARKNEVQALIAGQDERANWIKLNEFINSALPVPGPKDQGGTLDDDSRRPLWSTPQGLEALKKYQSRLARGLDPKIGWDDDTRSALAVVDIEGVYCRYTDDLKAFFDKAKEDSKKEVGADLDGMLEDEKKTPPEKGGWVVEIRGTTSYSQKVLYQNGEKTLQGREFLLQTLVKNLQDEAKKKSDVAEVVRGNVSHVFLWAAFEDKSPVLDSFKFLDKAPLIDFLIPPPGSESGSGTGTGTGSINPMGGVSALGGTGTGTGTDTGTPAASAPWVPLSSSGGAAAASSTGFGSSPMMGGTPGFGGGTTGSTNPYSLRGAAASTGTGPMGFGSAPSSGSDVTPKGSGSSGETVIPLRKPKPRYEFVVVFVWREPTPSDKFIKKDAAK